MKIFPTAFSKGRWCPGIVMLGPSTFAVGALEGPWLKIQALFCWNMIKSIVQAPVTNGDTASLL